ncbi:uncharacterized protein LOC119725890 [Patiria miniata]|uniref:Uncharacterized protein n=1 Tax=Patiria miniata TaxID=46514 RepID=A0A913ZNV1_PATMI|nr:uncharacterized protein LOC119725890 [Patiria miniata]
MSVDLSSQLLLKVLVKVGEERQPSPGILPRNTMSTAVAMLPEKNAPISDKKDVAVVYMIEDKHLQVSVDHDHGRNRRAAYCACAVVLTSLILVAGTLGIVTIVLSHSSRVTSDVEPLREPLHPDGNSFTEIPEASPRLMIDDGGLWPPGPMTPDLVSLNSDEVGRPPEPDEQASGNSSGDNEVADQHEGHQENLSGSHMQSSSYSSESDPGFGYFSDMYYDSG